MDENPGLTLAEVKNESCMKTLDTLTGATEENIESIFKATDANGDGFVMMSEAMASLKGMALDRSSPKCKLSGKTTPGVWGGKHPLYECSNDVSCEYCTNCSC